MDELEDELAREPEPTQKLLKAISEELAVPAFVFFMQTAPRLKESIPDFRSSQPAASAKSKATIEAIQFATAVQETAQKLDVTGVPTLPHFEVSSKRQEIESSALAARTFFGISIEDQSSSKDARVFYNVCRKKIEDKGIFVFHSSFPADDGSGFCLAHPKHPVIVVNTKQQTRARRLFTMIHELAHVLLGQTGISDPFIRENKIERACNHFASDFLLPRKYVEELLKGFKPPVEPDIDNVAFLARRLKVSQQATILRLEELGLVKKGSHTNWLRAIGNLGNPDFSERTGGGAGGPPPQEKVKLAKYGFRFAQAFDEPLRAGLISEINLYRATGLKPKYQKEYFSFVKSINNSRLQQLELGDE